MGTGVTVDLRLLSSRGHLLLLISCGTYCNTDSWQRAATRLITTNHDSSTSRILPRHGRNQHSGGGGSSSSIGLFAIAVVARIHLWRLQLRTESMNSRPCVIP